jgi:hypothetical protein
VVNISITVQRRSNAPGSDPGNGVFQIIEKQGVEQWVRPNFKEHLQTCSARWLIEHPASQSWLDVTMAR